MFTNNQLLELFTFIEIETELDIKPKEFKVPVFTLLILNTETPPIVTNGVPVKPVCVVPSIFIGVVTLTPDKSVIVCEPVPILKTILSVPAKVLASSIACLKEPAPASAVVVTVNVAALESSHIKPARSPNKYFFI